MKTDLHQNPLFLYNSCFHTTPYRSINASVYYIIQHDYRGAIIVTYYAYYPYYKEYYLMRSVPINRIIKDIAIQEDILVFLKSGGTIITRKPRKTIRTLLPSALDIRSRVSL